MTGLDRPGPIAGGEPIDAARPDSLAGPSGLIRVRLHESLYNRSRRARPYPMQAPHSDTTERGLDMPTERLGRARRSSGRGLTLAWLSLMVPIVAAAPIFAQEPVRLAGKGIAI